MFGSRDFPTLKLISVVNLPWEAQSRERVQLRNLKFPIVSNANSLQNSMQFSTLKSENLKNQTFAHSRILSTINNSIYMYDFWLCIYCTGINYQSSIPDN